MSGKHQAETFVLNPLGASGVRECGRVRAGLQLYIHQIQPLVKRHEEEIDRALESGRKKAASGVEEVKSKAVSWINSNVRLSALGS